MDPDSDGAYTADGDKSEYVTYKAGLAKLLRHPHHEAIITAQACQVSKLATRALLLVKLYVLHQHETNGEIEKIDYTFMLNALKVVGHQPSVGRTAKSGIRAKLADLYKVHFAPLLPEGDERPSYEHLDDVLQYTARNLVASLETNITQHFEEYVESYVDAVFHKEATLALIGKLVLRKDRVMETQALNRKLRIIKMDLLHVKDDGFQSPKKYHDWIRRHKLVVLPETTHDTKNSLAYDLKCHPQDYLVPMVRMTARMEAMGRKLRNFLPVRTSLIPMHITLDSTALVKLFYSAEFEEKLGKSKGALLGAPVKANKDDIWALVFRTDERIFHKTKSYAFNHMVRTDGVSCCVVKVRKSDVNNEGDGAKRTGTSNSARPSEKYIDELTDDERRRLSDKIVVGVDPGMGNLLYFSSEDGKTRKRYTQNQRRQETKVREYDRRLVKKKGKTVVEDWTITQWEAKLSAHNHKTASLAAFKEYIHAKLWVNSKIGAFYEKHWHRQQRLNGYFNRNRSESRLLEELEAKFGAPKDVVIGFGDWEQLQHRKFKEPVKGKGFRQTLRRGGYRVFLVDEHRTSLQCSLCQQENAKCHKFLPSTRCDSSGRSWFVHGLLLCQQCRRPRNRDANASMNIACLTRTALAGQSRPEHLRRSCTARKKKRAAKSSDDDDEARKIPRVVQLLV